MKRTWSVVLSIIGTTFFLIIAFGSLDDKKKKDSDSTTTGSDSTAVEDQHDREKVVVTIDSARNAMHQLYARFGKLARNRVIFLVKKDSLPAENCKQSLLVEHSQQRDKKELFYSGMKTAYLPHLIRYAFPEKEEYWKNHGEWKWLTSDDIVLHMDRPVDDWTDKSVERHYKAVYKDFLKDHYLCIIYPDIEAGNKMPVYYEEEESFTAGYFKGWVMIGDLTNGKAVCWYPIEVTNSEEISYRSGGRGLGKLLNESPAKAVRKDFKENFKAAIEARLNEKVKVNCDFLKLF